MLAHILFFILLANFIDGKPQYNSHYYTPFYYYNPYNPLSTSTRYMLPYQKIQPTILPYGKFHNTFSGTSNGNQNQGEIVGNQNSGNDVSSCK